MAKRKPKQIALDSSGDEVPCYTLAQAATLLRMSKSDLRIIMYRQGHLPYYKLMGRGKRRIIRVKAEDLNEYRESQQLFDTI